nr:DUF1847 domain-containing protein [uncultured Carboxylicivirga sp.]
MGNQDYIKLYNAEDKSILKIAEDSLNPKIDRVSEIIAYCHQAGIKKVGIANCIAFEKQTEKLEQILTSNHLEVAKANCKLGKVKFDDLVPGYKGTSCNPAGQAEYLHQNETELNIMIGLCVGHDMIFNAKSKVPVTPLAVKDRKLKHHPLDALNTKNAKL